MLLNLFYEHLEVIWQVDTWTTELDSAKTRGCNAFLLSRVNMFSFHLRDVSQNFEKQVSEERFCEPFSFD